MPVVMDAEVGEEIRFETESFSVYGFIGTVIEKTILASDGHNYHITVTYGPETGIPEDADLDISEIDSNTAEYYQYEAKAEAALGMEPRMSNYMRLFDISIVDKNNPMIKYQPAAGTAVDVRIELADSQSKDLSVVHFADEDAQGDVVNAKTDGQAVSFEANGFSVYAVIGGTEPTARMALEFHVESADGQDHVVATMFVKNADRDPEHPEILEMIIFDPYIGQYLNSGEIFRGWTFDENYTAEVATTPYHAVNAPTGAMTIDDIRSWVMANEIDEDDDELVVNKLYAIIVKNFIVKYLDPDGNAVATEPAYMLRSENTAAYTINQTYTAQDDAHNFEGWIIKDEDTLSNVTYTGAGQLEQIEIGDYTYDLYKVLTEVTLYGDAIFHAHVPEGNWLIFDEVKQGATFTAARFLEPGETTELPTSETMKLLGYNFAGWYTHYEKDETNGTETYSGLIEGTDLAGSPNVPPVTYGGEDVTAKTTLYARWVPEDWAPYTVIIWMEDLDQPDPSKKEYSYAESIRLYGPVGEKITIGSDNNNSAMLSIVDYVDADYLYIYGQDVDKNYVTYDKKATHSRTPGTSSVVHTYTNEDYIGFNLVRFEDEDGNEITDTENSVIINPEGNSIVNVYYDRIKYTVKVYFANDGTHNTSGTSYHLYHYRAGKIGRAHV